MSTVTTSPQSVAGQAPSGLTATLPRTTASVGVVAAAMIVPVLARQAD
jgi:hypothetical protein